MSKVISRKELLNFPNGQLFKLTKQHSKILVFDNKLKYKEFSDILYPFSYPEDKIAYDNLLLQTEEQSDFISFPISIVTSPKKVYGIVSHFEEGNNFSNLDPSLDVYIIMNQLERLEKEIKRLSFKGWVLSDLHRENILIDNNYNIKIIDTDCYYIDQDRKPEDIYKENLVSLFDLLLTSILSPLFKSKIMNNKKLFRYQMYAINGDVTPVEFMATLICTLYKYPPEHLDIETFTKKML